MEWIEDYDEAEPGMSHMSQLLGAYPLADITPANQTTFNWAISSLNRRLSNGGGSIGWPRAWVMALAARFFQPDLVSQGVVYQLQKAYRPTSMMNVGAPAQFQIDANFGSAAGMAEALLQSHEWLTADSTTASLRGATYGDAGRVTLIRLLPALPKAWAANGGGFARGLRARGGFQVDLTWNSAGSLQSANITSLNDSPAWVTLGSNLIGGGGKAIKVSGGSSGPFVKISGGKGSVVTITLA
jgi:alpha-L-fucosidase 2